PKTHQIYSGNSHRDPIIDGIFHAGITSPYCMKKSGATSERQTAPWHTDSSMRPMRQCSTPRRAVEGYREPMVPLPHILRQALAPALRRLWPSTHTRALSRPFQANPLAPPIRRAVHAAQAFVVLGDPGDCGAAQYSLAQQLIREFRQRP